MCSTGHVSSYISNCECKITLILRLKWRKKETHLWHHITVIQTLLIFLASRWEFGIIEFLEARRTSYPAHFTVSSQMDVISPILWMNGNALNARALPPHMCTAQRLAVTILRVTHLSPGSRPWFYEAMHYQRSIHFPQETRTRFVDKWWALSQISCRVK